MRPIHRPAVIAGAFALALWCGEAAGHPDQPYVTDGMFSNWDVAALKAGDWVEHEEIVLEQPVRTRLACVAVEEEVAWIEYTGPVLSMWEETALLVSVRKKDRLIDKALWGGIGYVPREIKVEHVKTAGPAEGVERIGTGVVREETLKVGEKDLTCEKVAVDYKSGESPFRNRVWTSSDVPFRYNPPVAHLADLKWDGKAAYPGGLVKREVENPANGQVAATVLVGWGHDATRALKEK
ncbi:MAG: hypothetical protein HYY18_00470 [Planctomycetes bacterium]|nr:hypothetical protein [Planctomycetota bacterium]